MNIKNLLLLISLLLFVGCVVIMGRNNRATINNKQAAPSININDSIE